MTTTKANSEALNSVLRSIHQARAVMRSVELAAAAQEHGDVNYSGDNGARRWWPAIGFAVQRIECVRDIAINSVTVDGVGLCSVAWYTPLALLEALDAALWRGCSDSEKSMNAVELQAAAQAVIEALETLAEECATVH